MTEKSYSYKDSLKSDLSDELVNIYLQRPLAGLLTRLVYSTPVTPNQLTAIGILFGIAGSIMLSLSGTEYAVAAGCFYLKDLFDSADGQLARAKKLYSRRGRFLDSIGDFVVNVLLFAALCTWLVSHGLGWTTAVSLACIGFLGVTLRVSYHVFYQTSFLHTRQEYQTNRLSEEVTPEDLSEDPATVRLQRAFLFLYGWQDRMMIALDVWSRGKRDLASNSALRKWYGDPAALRLSGFLGLGTEFVLLTLCLFVHAVEAYLFITIVVLNGVWLTAVLYRRFALAMR